MTLDRRFKAIDKQFDTFQHVISDEKLIAQSGYAVLFGEQQIQILKNVGKDLQIIRDFYHDRFYNKNTIPQSDIVDKYSELYSILYQLSQNNLDLNKAINTIETSSNEWLDEIVLDSILNVCYSIAWLIPLIAGAAILPFALPLLSLSTFVGLSVLIASTSSMFLSISKVWDNLSSIENTTPVVENTLLERSLLTNMNAFYQSNLRKNIKLDSSPENQEQITEETGLSC
ncbi:DUF5638 domain-containing protein [Legionella bononiensis]|uniref:DUF5638 domain-containing protein n=1 Tax=Legionella bononiensis TaxID=2793102 RepID=A0ABS1WBB0_9GAMM|nr:DUF5638 domain-containing protein [Legionella bononiensis]MBL7480932.1 hypothetical protein [Legionella bononiensis]MBL7526640.1 hypothetical protein [Legionella bononiensis]MBL7564047.1 hypothetical protein [Legionella bononiensis]